MVKVYFGEEVLMYPDGIELVTKTKEFSDLASAQEWCHNGEVAHALICPTIRENGKFCRKANAHKFELCRNRLCYGNCAYGEICPWQTHEYGPCEDVFPTEQECAEDSTLKTYVNPRTYIVNCHCARVGNEDDDKIEVDSIHDAIKIANAKLEKYIRVSITRKGYDIPLCVKSCK